MTLPLDSVIADRLMKLFPNSRLRELDRDTGLIQREGGKLGGDALFGTLTLGFVAGQYRTLEEFRQEYLHTAGGTLSYAAFHGWFTDALCAFLREILEEAMADLSHAEERLSGRFEQFRGVFIVDMTVITLYQSLTVCIRDSVTTTRERSFRWSRLFRRGFPPKSPLLMPGRTIQRSSRPDRG